MMHLMRQGGLKQPRKRPLKEKAEAITDAQS